MFRHLVRFGPRRGLAFSLVERQFMAGAIFLVREDGQLVEMVETPYNTESVLQELLAKYPGVLAGDQMNATAPHKWLLVKREMGVPGEDGGGNRWCLDHLFVDQHGVPTLVEVKQSTNSEIRRRVVGQMLDYAANAVAYWSSASMRHQFEERCNREGTTAEACLAKLLETDTDPDEFWETVDTNLRAGRIRMVFVADAISTELARIVEFLNGQMEFAEVLALEVKQYQDEQSSLKTLVPRLIGRPLARRNPPENRWDESSFIAKLKENGLTAEVPVLTHLLEWTKQSGLEFSWGAGATSGSFNAALVHNGFRQRLFTAWTQGTVEVRLLELKTCRPFDAEDKQRDLIRRLNEVPGVNLPETSINGIPGIRMSVLTSPPALEKFLTVMAWIVAEIKATGPAV